MGIVKIKFARSQNPPVHGRRDSIYLRPRKGKNLGKKYIKYFGGKKARAKF